MKLRHTDYCHNKTSLRSKQRFSLEHPVPFLIIAHNSRMLGCFQYSVKTLKSCVDKMLLKRLSSSSVSWRPQILWNHLFRRKKKKA